MDLRGKVKFFRVNDVGIFFWTSKGKTKNRVSQPDSIFVLQEKWAKNLYLACLCYGRTVS